jgi:hypothetical protein
VAAEPGLTQDEKRRLAEWLRLRGVKGCPICAVNKWGIADHLVAPPPYAADGQPTGDVSYPQAMLVCGNCAYTAYFNAAVIGLGRRDAQEK